MQHTVRAYRENSDIFLLSNAAAFEVEMISSAMARDTMASIEALNCFFR